MSDEDYVIRVANVWKIIIRKSLDVGEREIIDKGLTAVRHKKEEERRVANNPVTAML